MDVMTFFVGIIAFCMVVLTVMVIIFLLSVSRSLKAVDEKVALLVFELSQILPNIRKTTQNIADMSGVLNIFSFFKKTK
jgi:uncharacterized protein YoxC